MTRRHVNTYRQNKIQIYISSIVTYGYHHTWVNMYKCVSLSLNSSRI